MPSPDVELGTKRIAKVIWKRKLEGKEEEKVPGSRSEALVFRFGDGKDREPQSFGPVGRSWRCVDEAGDSFDAAKDPMDNCSWAIGIWNASKGILEIRDVDGGTKRLLSRHLSGGEEDECMDGKEQGKAEGRRRLIHAFGSQKRRRQEMRRDANRVEKEQMGGLHLQEQLQAAVTTQMTGEEDVSDKRRVLSKDEMLKRAAREARVLLPVHVEAATDAKAAYPIQDVLPGHLQEELDELADKLLQAARSQTITDRKTDPSKENQMLDSDGWPIFAKRYADAILARAASEEEEMVLKRVLGYLTLLLIFYASSSFFKAESQLCEKLHLSTTTAAHLLSRFTKEITKDGGNSYQKTRNSTLSLQYHILLLLLVLHGYSMNPVEVPQMLKISMRDVLQRFRELGAQYSIVSSAGKKIHTVTLLQNNTDGKTLEDNFPQLKIGRGR